MSTFPSRQKEKRPSPFGWRVNSTGGLRWLERLALWVEQPLNTLTRSLKLNIFYHTDTLAVFLWALVALTGVYVTFFYQFGFDGSYLAVAKIQSQIVARTIRAVHRYASGAAVIITLLHAYRTFFMDRFRGARWLAWVSGLVMLLLLWMDGVTGYWMIWDQRAQAITASAVNFLNRYFGSSGNALAFSLFNAQQNDGSWFIMFLLLTAHVLLFGGVALFFWFHIIRLNKPKFFAPQIWMIGLGAIILIVSAFFPVGMLPQASSLSLPTQIDIDPFFLFHLPAALDSRLADAFWIGLLTATALIGVLPWLMRRRKPAPVKVTAEACIGCTLCATDCPYNALEMVERTDGHGSKLVAVTYPEKCVSCGICVGSCEYNAIQVGQLNAQAVFAATRQLIARSQEERPEEQIKIIFTCERHAAHGARPFVRAEAGVPTDETRILTIPLPCVGALPPSLIGATTESGASSVQVIGCPPDDCAQRRGNTWAQARLLRKRKPWLRVPFKHAPISFTWQPPNRFRQALGNPAEPDKLTWRNYLPIAALLVGLFILQIWFSKRPFRVFPAPQARVQLIVPDISATFGIRAALPDQGIAALPVHVTLYANHAAIAAWDYAPEAFFTAKAQYLYTELSLPPGDYTLELRASAGDHWLDWTAYHVRLTLKDRQIFPIHLLPAVLYSED